MKKVDRLINLEVARVLLIEARGLVELACMKLRDAYGLIDTNERSISEEIGYTLANVIEAQNKEQNRESS